MERGPRLWVRFAIIGGLLFIPDLVFIMAATAGWRSVIDAMTGLPWPMVTVLLYSGFAGFILLLYAGWSWSETRRVAGTEIR